MTVDELRAELDALGVDAPASALKADLEQLLVDALASAPAVPVPDPVPSAGSGTVRHLTRRQARGDR